MDKSLLTAPLRGPAPDDTHYGATSGKGTSVVRSLTALITSPEHKLLLPTFGVLAGAQIIDVFDGDVLSCALRSLERSLGLTPSQMAHVAMAGTISKALGAPPWGVLTDKYDRRLVLTGGILLWAIVTATLGMVASPLALVIVRAINGVALASIGPLSQSLLADLTPPDVRGTCFGLFHGMSSFGEVVANLTVPGIAAKMILGIEGWRFTCYLVAAASLFYAAVVLRFLVDPRARRYEKDNDCASPPTVPETLREVFGCKTYLLVCLQGIFGSMPYSTFGFLIIWLQYLGFSAAAAGLIVSAKPIGGILGHVVAGVTGDWAARYSPDHGRVAVAQVADVCRVPVLLLLLVYLPRVGAHSFLYAWTLFLLGALMPFPSIACSRPIFTEVVRPELRGSIISYQAMVEGLMGSLGAFWVGRLAQYTFHYQTSRAAVEDMPPALREQNARALGLALVITTTIPWTICTILYSLVHFTYKHDRYRAAQSHSNML